jgi:hypothetical protein
VAGSWELRQQNSVLVGILHTDIVPIAWSFGLRNLQIPGAILPVAGMPYDMARNVICMKALEMGAEWVFHLDSDVIPPNDAIPRLIAHKQPIISGMYCRRSPPVSVPVMIRGANWHTNFPMGSLQEVDLVGAGCLLIHRTVLEKLPPISPERGKHWFDWRVDMAGILPQGEALSEDFSFNLHARRHGYKVLVDTSIQCRHVGLGQSSYGRFDPCEATPVT